MWALVIAHFQEDQTKYQPSQTHMCVYIYKAKSHTHSLQLGEISAVHAVVCQFGEITPRKNWKNLHAGKNSFLCIKSVLQKNPCG